VRSRPAGGCPPITIVAAFVLIASAGCQLAPRLQRPALPTAAAWPQEYGGDPQSGEPASALGWRDFFADPRLDALIGAALQHNRDLEVAVAQVEEARGLYRIQRADRLPTLDVSAEAARTRVSPRSARVGGAAGGDFGAVRPGAETATFERYSLAVGMTAFELDFWGRVRQLSEAARAQYLASAQAARAFRLSLIREVALAYLDTLEARERTELAEATVRSRREGLRIAKRRLDAGVTSALEFRQAETLLTQAETELAALHLARAQSENLLAVLVGGPMEEPLPDPLPLAQQIDLQQLAPGLPSEVLTARPDILAAEERLLAARASVGAARAAFFPSIALIGSYGYASTELDELVGKDAQTWSFGPSITLPVFDFGRRRSNLTVAQARENIAIAGYERAIQAGFQEVSNALAGRRYLAEQVAAQERALAAQRDLAELARTRYREGVVRYIEVLDAERNLFAAEQSLLQVRRAEAANLVALYVALGGGQVERR
jgi:multidrug efflux system outer membrane protein